jgi:hypothetical protein
MEAFVKALVIAALLAVPTIAIAKTNDAVKADAPKLSYVTTVEMAKAVACIHKDNTFNVNDMPNSDGTEDVEMLFNGTRMALFTLTPVDGGIRVDSRGMGWKYGQKFAPCMGVTL